MASDVGEAEVEAGACAIVRMTGHDDPYELVMHPASKSWEAPSMPRWEEWAEYSRAALEGAAAARSASSPQDGGEALREARAEVANLQEKLAVSECALAEERRRTHTMAAGRQDWRHAAEVAWRRLRRVLRIAREQRSLAQAWRKEARGHERLADLMFEIGHVDGDADKPWKDRAAAAERERDEARAVLAETRAVLRRVEWGRTRILCSPAPPTSPACSSCCGLQPAAWMQERPWHDFQVNHTDDCAIAALAAALDPPPRGATGPSGTRDGQGEVGDVD